MKRSISWFIGLGIAVSILGSSTFVSAAPEQVSGVAFPCVEQEQADKIVCTFAIKPWGPNFKGVYSYTVDTLGKDVDWKADPRVQVYSKRTQKVYTKTNEAMLALQTGDLVIITKAKPAPPVVTKPVVPAAPADKVVVFKSGDVPHALALTELGDAAAWNLSGVRFLHPTRDEEFAKTDEATRRYPIGTRMVISHNLLAARSKSVAGVAKVPADDRKARVTVPIAPPREIDKKAAPSDPQRAAFVLPIPDRKGNEPTKPAAENLPPPAPESFFTDDQRMGAARSLVSSYDEVVPPWFSSAYNPILFALAVAVATSVVYLAFPLLSRRRVPYSTYTVDPSWEPPVVVPVKQGKAPAVMPAHPDGVFQQRGGHSLLPAAVDIVWREVKKPLQQQAYFNGDGALFTMWRREDGVVLAELTIARAFRGVSADELAADFESAINLALRKTKLDRRYSNAFQVGVSLGEDAPGHTRVIAELADREQNLMPAAQAVFAAKVRL